VRRGQDVAPTTTLGAVGRSGDPRDRRPHVHLGARDAATDRYIDPLTLLRGARPALPLLPPTARVRPRPQVPLGPAPQPAPSRELPRLVPLDPAPELVPSRELPRPVPLGSVLEPGRPRALPSAPARRPAALPLSLGPAMPHLAPLRPAPPHHTPGSDAWDPSAPTVAPRSAPASRRVPRTVWVGLVCAGLALRVTGFVRKRRHRRAAAQVARTA
jgi:hypothetical protein